MPSSSWKRAERKTHARGNLRRKPIVSQPLRLELLEDRCLLSQGATLGSLIGPDAVTQAQVASAYGQTPLQFEANQGQSAAQVQFLARGAGYAVFLTPGEAVLSLQKSAAAGAATPAPVTLRLGLAGADPGAQAVGLDPLPGVSNYYVGNDPSQWQSAVPNYASVEYHDVYPGVDLIYYGNQQQLEYTFVVAPGANPGDIGLAIEGATGIALDAQGDLLLHTAGGDVVEHAPVLYQESAGVRTAVAGGYVLQGDGHVGLQVGAYDSSKPLIIDPVLSYSTYLGGNGLDQGLAVAVDSSGDAYVTGQTDSTNFPTLNPAQASGGGASADVFVAKLNPGGTAVLYSTYFGGSDNDQGNAIAVDSSGAAYVAGSTLSADFPTTTGAVQSTLKGFSNGFVFKLNAAGALAYSTYLGGSASDAANGVAVDSSGAAYVTGYTQSADFPTTTGALQTANASRTAYKTTTAGTGWGGLAGLPDVVINLVAVDPRNTSTLYAGSVQGILKSTDGGVTWNPSNTGLPASPDVTALVVNPNTTATLYANVLAVGVFSSTNGGAAWSPVGPGLAGNVNVLAIDPTSPTTLYAGTDNGVFKSLDGGASWNAADGGLPSGAFVNALVVDPHTSATLYADVSGVGVFKSTNGGATWAASNTGLPAVVNALTIDPTTTANLYASTGAGVFKSTNGGAAWAASNSGLPASAFVTALVVDPITSSNVYAVVSGVGVFKSTNGGAAWAADSTGLANPTINALAIDPLNPATLYTANNPTEDAFVAKLNAAGASLVYSTFLGGGNDDVGRAIAVDGAGNAYVAGSTSSTNFPTANPFQASLGGTTNAFVAKLNAAGSALVYATYLGGGGNDSANAVAVDAGGNAYVAGSTSSTNFPLLNASQATLNGGTNAFVTELTPAGSALVYSTYLGGGGNDSANAIAVDAGGNAYVVGGTSSNDFPTTAGAFQSAIGSHASFKSTNGGTNWSALTAFPDFSVARVVVDPQTSTNVYLATDHGVYKSTDGGATFNPVNSGLTQLTINTLVIDPKNPGTLYAATGNGVFKTTNGGTSWVLDNSLAVSALAVDPVTTTTLYAASDGSVFKSTDGGATWNLSDTGLTGFVNVLAVDPSTPATIYAGTDSGVFKSTNGAGAWFADNSGLTGGNVSALAIDPSTPATIYAGTDAGLFKSTNGAAAWSAANSGLTGVVNALAIDPLNTANVYAGTDGGVFTSTNGAAAWTASGVGLPGSTFVAALAVDPKTSGTVYVGYAASTDAFLTKLGPTGARVYSTFLGGSGSDSANGVAVDGSGNAYVTGNTTSVNFPVGAPLQPSFAGGTGDAFVAKIATTASPAAATHFSVTAHGSAVAGLPFTITVTALDGSNNVASGYTGKVNFTSTDGAALLPMAYTFTAADNGSHTFTVTLKTTGNDSVKAADAVNTGINGTAAVTVAAGATHFGVTSTPAAAGSSFNVTVTALDLNNAAVANYLGTVQLTSSDPTAVVTGAFTTLPIDYTFTAADNGAHVFGLTLLGAGSQTVTAADVTNSAISGTGPVTVAPAPHFSITTQGGVVAGAPFDLVVTVQDSSNTTLTGYTGTVTFTSTDASAVLPADYTFAAGDAGTHSFPITLQTVGAQSVTVSDTSNPVLTGQAAETVAPAPHFVVALPAGGAMAGQSFNFTVTAEDSSDNILTGYTGTVHFTSSDPNFGPPPDTTFTAANNGVVTVPGILDASGSQTITATDTVNSLATGVGRITVSAAPGGASFTVKAPATVIAGTPFPFILTALDGFGNVATGYTGTVHFTSPGTPPGDYTFTAGDQGVHTFNVAVTGTGSETVTATDTANTNLTASASPNVVAAAGQTFTVINTSSSGLGSLAQAITDSNNAPGLNTIKFSIGTGLQTLALTSPLPAVTNPVIIDGDTQPGFAGAPLIVLDGGATGGGDGLDLFGGQTTVRGLEIINFPNVGIFVESDGNVLQGNYIGTDAAGDAHLGNTQLGVEIVAGNFTTVGGTTPGTGNVISGNLQDGVFISYGGSTQNVIEGNLIGVNPAGNAAVPNTLNGVEIQSAQGNTVGGTAAGAGNVLSGNNFSGVFIDGSGATHNVVEGNLIGTDVSGTHALGNTLAGVDVNFSATNNTVGGLAPGAGNTIAFNGDNGVLIGLAAGTGNAVLSNSIYSNTPLGIKVGNDNGQPTLNDSQGHSGPNDFQDFPVLTSVTQSAGVATVNGTLSGAANTPYTLQLFLSPTGDPSGFGQGQTLVASGTITTGADGNVSFTAHFTSVPGDFITATATDPGNNTSEFSHFLQIPATPTAPAITSANSATFNVGAFGSFTVIDTGVPTPTLTESPTDTLPGGVTFNGSTGVLSGTPAAGSARIYTLHFTAANGVGTPFIQTFTLTVTNSPFSVNGKTLTVTGTAGNDTFTFAAGSPEVVTLNGTSFNVPAAVTVIQFQGDGGNDRATLTGGSGGNSLSLSPGGGTLSGAGYAVTVSGVATVIAIDQAGNKDTADLSDAGHAGANTFTATTTAAYFNSPNNSFFNEAVGFHTVVASAAAGGTDLAVLFGAASGTGSFTGLDGTSYLSTLATFAEAVGFPVVVANSIGGHDTATLFDAGGGTTNQFVGTSTQGYLYDSTPGRLRPNYFNEANAFQVVVARATPGASDTATLFDGSGTNTFYAYPTFAYLTNLTSSYFNEVVGFPAVAVNAVVPQAVDVAYFAGSGGAADVFTGTPTSDSLQGGNYLYTVLGFRAVAATEAGGGAAASLIDNRGGATYSGSGVYGLLAGQGYSIALSGFSSVAATALDNVADHLNLLALDYAFSATPPADWQ